MEWRNYFEETEDQNVDSWFDLLDDQNQLKDEL